MTLDEYQKATGETAVYPISCDSNNVPRYLYLALALAGEAGEVANITKKVIRDDACIMTPSKELELLDELGDVLWYVAQEVEQLGWSLEYVASLNLAKLKARQEQRRKKMQNE